MVGSSRRLAAAELDETRAVRTLSRTLLRKFDHLAIVVFGSDCSRSARATSPAASAWPLTVQWRSI